ncbi:MAG: lysine--tRNA ligase, partial [Anaerolineales bacterium]|nr:lysine--tRNA ligase [Anaerolineales bacterium]
MTNKFTVLEEIRLKKIKKLRAQDIEPFPNRAQRTHTSVEAIREFENNKSKVEQAPGSVILVGRIRSIRPMGKISFAHIEDGYGRIQLFLRANDIGQEQIDFFNRNFDLGDFIQASGVMFRTRTGEVTLQV